MHFWSKILLSTSGNVRRLVSRRWSVKFKGSILSFDFFSRLFVRAHANEGPEPAYHKIVSGYELFQQRNEPFQLKYNQSSLSQFDLAYETWGTLNASKNNAVLIFTGLSASSHAKSHEVGDLTMPLLDSNHLRCRKTIDRAGGNSLLDLIWVSTRIVSS